MANVLFKQGTQSALDTIRTNLNAIEGTFYLTTDTHRLYIGRPVTGGVDAVPVNEGVTTVKELSNLPTVTTANASQYAGQFYYVSDLNILCVYSGQRWVQINPNTNTKVEGLDVAVTVASGVATVKTTVKNTTADGQTGGDSFSDQFTMTGAKGVTVSATGDAVTITGDQYDLTTGDAVTTGQGSVKLKLKSGSNHNSQVTISGGTNATVKETTTGTIEISSKNTTLDSSSVSAGSGPNAQNTSGNGFYVRVVDTDTNGNTATIDPTIKLGTNNTSYHFTGGTATLPVYTKTEIDDKLKGLDAMTYKGVVGDGHTLTALPTTGVQNGDTYKIDTPITTPVKAGKGDIVIATGTEDPATGVLTNITWEVISAGDDEHIDTTYVGVAVDKGMSLQENTTKDTVATMKIAAGTAMSVSDNKSADGKSNTITVTHGNVSHTDATGTAVSQNPTKTMDINAVTGVEVNAQGHVTKVTTTKFTVRDSASKVDNVAFNASTASSTANGVVTTTATVTNSVKTIDGANDPTTKSGDFKLSSSSLTVSSTAAVVGSDGKTTTPPVVTVDMVWGTF